MLISLIIIKGNKITMKGVEFKLGIDNNGSAKIMYPGYYYVFPGLNM